MQHCLPLFSPTSPAVTQVWVPQWVAFCPFGPSPPHQTSVSLLYWLSFHCLISICWDAPRSSSRNSSLPCLYLLLRWPCSVPWLKNCLYADDSQTYVFSFDHSSELQEQVRMSLKADRIEKKALPGMALLSLVCNTSTLSLILRDPLIGKDELPTTAHCFYRLP